MTLANSNTNAVYVRNTVSNAPIPSALKDLLFERGSEGCFIRQHAHDAYYTYDVIVDPNGEAEYGLDFWGAKAYLESLPVIRKRGGLLSGLFTRNNKPAPQKPSRLDEYKAIKAKNSTRKGSLLAQYKAVKSANRNMNDSDLLDRIMQ